MSAKLFDPIEIDSSLDPLEMAVNKEKSDEALKCLKLLLAELTETQQKILLLTSEGYKENAISKKIGIPQTTVSYHKRKIPKIFDKLTSDEELEKVKSKIETAKHSGKKEKLKKEYEHKIAIREAMQTLSKYLLSSPMKTVTVFHSPTPIFTFEKKRKVCTGTRRTRVYEGYKYVSDFECKMPEYLSECGIGGTVCTLCNNCKRTS